MNTRNISVLTAIPQEHSMLFLNNTHASTQGRKEVLVRFDKREFRIVCIRILSIGNLNTSFAALRAKKWYKDSRNVIE